MTMYYAKGAPSFVEQEFAKKAKSLLKEVGGITDTNCLEFVFKLASMRATSTCRTEQFQPL